jgi:flagellar motor component MotA
MLEENPMKRNYFLSILALAFCFAGTVYFSGGRLINYLDIPSMVIMVIFPFVYQCLVFGISAAGRAFAAAFRENVTEKELLDARLFYKSYGKIVRLSAFVTVLTGTVAILINLEDRQLLGPNFALALISLLYGGMLHIAIIIPNSVFLEKRLTELSVDL